MQFLEKDLDDKHNFFNLKETIHYRKANKENGLEESKEQAVNMVHQAVA